ncbi:site-specific DNA-methyltransferase [Flavobacterium sp.]|jgi:adenine-specific DNA-methyltransferase|uniref:site-specific DNA-methyltransferase n=1 Tax=Flavobacterium sp. TaxID=239 RepID=UPI00286F911C|nr:site-specific DNA-methyltransferase [Flavobacterium sp.]
MEKITQDHPLAKSPDIVQQNIDVLKGLFPTIVKDGKIDLEEFKALIGDDIETDEEYYRFTWAGKSIARKESNKPSTATLRPCKSESKDWDTTNNIFIEGDNLEVLKLLAKSYNNRVKVVYIDVPYNTGKDFVYKDNYTDNLSNYFSLTGQIDEMGNKKSTNSESDGRFHSNWLNMMYPRIKLARNLLTEDGLIFISIDDNEITNLKKICDEIYGEENFLAQLIWKKKQGGGNDSKNFVIEHEYILCYAKSINNVSISLDKKYVLDDALYPFNDVNGDYGLVTLDKSSIQFSQSLVYEITDTDGNKYLPRVVNGKQSCWRWGKDKVENEFDKLVFKNGKVYTKYYRPLGVTPKSLLIDTRFGRTESGQDDIKSLFGNAPFSYPKPVSLISHLLAISTNEDDLILDFFAGSGTTGQAVLQLNSEDGGERKYICVQLPEKTDESSEAFNSGYFSLSEITKERIRRAGEKIKSEINNDLFSKTDRRLDIGFKVFKLDSSNINSWDSDPANLASTLFNASDNIKSDRTEEDVLFEILLKNGLDLSIPIEERDIEGCRVYNVGFGTLFICLSNSVSTKVAEGIGAWKKELQPATCRVIFKDSGFSDVEKTNSMQILKRFGIEEVNTI